MDGADVCGTSSRASRRPPDVISAVAILDPRWRRRKWRHPGPGAVFSTPIAAAAQDGGPSASGRHLGWPHLRNRKWGHPRWRPEAEGPPSCAAAAMGVEKTALYYSDDNTLQWFHKAKASQITIISTVCSALCSGAHHWLCEGNPPITGGFRSQRASNAENVSIWWRHHEYHTD